MNNQGFNIDDDIWEDVDNKIRRDSIKGICKLTILIVSLIFLISSVTVGMMVIINGLSGLVTTVPVLLAVLSILGIILGRSL